MKPQPAFASPYSNLVPWVTSLDALAALHAKIVVPSHGPIGDASYIAGYREYLIAIRDRAAALKKEDKTLDETVQTVTSEMKGRYPDTGRLGGAVRAAFNESR